jgi:uncharacterized protein YecE (DUF72 family)
MHIYIGTSGYNYKHWKGRFYPEGLSQKDWLSHFAKFFDSVEINATFYHHFPRKTFEHWNEITPDNFVFTIKGPRFITHIKKIVDVDEALDVFFDELSGLQKKFPIILWQFPKSFIATDANKEKLFSFIKKLPSEFRNTFELRHDSWFEDDEIENFRNKNISLVINDTKAFDVTDQVTGSLVYIRFHGPGSLYASSYSDQQLKMWADKIKTWSQKYPVYCYFNNDLGGYALDNADTLKEYI